MHAFFRDSNKDGAANANGTGDANQVCNIAVDEVMVVVIVVVIVLQAEAAGSGDEVSEVVNFCDFVRVLAHFRPIKKKPEKNKMNSREEKLKCKNCSSVKPCDVTHMTV